MKKVAVANNIKISQKFCNSCVLDTNLAYGIIPSQATSNKQQATSNKQQATSNKQQATSNKRNLALQENQTHFDYSEKYKILEEK